MDSKLQIRDKSNIIYERLKEKFTRNLMNFDDYEIDDNLSEFANIFSRFLHAMYNSDSGRNKSDFDTSYFLNFTDQYLSRLSKDDLFNFYNQLVALSSKGLINGKINDIKLLLSEIDLTDFDYYDYNWLEILYLETMRLYLLIVRQGNNFEDIDKINLKIGQLKNIQENQENMMLEDKPLSQMEIAQLVVLYNIIAALNEVNSFLEKGKPAQIEVKIEKFHDNIRDVMSHGLDSMFQYSIENIIKGLEYLIKNSIWKQLKTGTRADIFIEEMVARGSENPIFQLLPSQVEAFNKGITDPRKSSIVVQMHTSAGKSFLAHYLIAQALQYNRDTEIAYVVPTRALVHQSLHDLRNTFKNMDYNIEATIPAYELDKVEEELLDEKIDILVTTPEKLNLLVRSNHESVKRLSFVVIDEAHNISDENRGIALEFLLATLKRKNDFIRTVLLTPFIKGDTNRELIADWLGGDRGLPVYSKWRPTRQLISILNRFKPDGERYYNFELETIKPEQSDEDFEYTEFKEEITFSTPKPDNYKTMATKIAKRFIDKGAVMILAESPFHAEMQACHLANSIDLKKDLSDDMKIFIKFIKEELGDDHELINCLEKGVAFHHSGLSEEVKILIEKFITRGDINYIVGTTTLAQGMNFPISTVVFRTIFFPRAYQANEEMDPDVFWNIAGRAGRVFKDYVGRVIFLVDDSEKRYKEIKSFINKQGSGINSAIFETIKNLDELSVRFNRDLVSDNQALSQLLQFISSTLNIMDISEEISDSPEDVIDELLRLSLAYKQLSEKGEAERRKLLGFAKKYLNYLQDKDNWKSIADLVDKTGFSSMTVDYLLSQKNDLPDFRRINLDNIVSKPEQMAGLIKILSGVPEINLGLGKTGDFNSVLVAQITNAWINGHSLIDIHNNLIKTSNIGKTNLRKTIRYIYQTITGKVSWGVGAMQSIALSDDEETDDILNLPSMIYYGVPDDKGVALRMAGLPRRLAVNFSKKIPDSEFSIKEMKLSGTRKWLETLSLDKWQKYSRGTGLEGNEWKRIWEILE
ncbi:DEAD/DEAH box helicase [Halanaerobiaceae bacterium Z-7014]|uniref:DEAD/DEAH box helicase n=1 Tax=Halonatronomonas betaini TaxID=2778430 RepID=A0A931AXB9_9FIRM|nr:DEAD/DEAH box helicase [Halonatronomonas betaini]MBF8436538.1 DEAD/DEAH box helicase [Halonatronomonas betaini]